MGILAIDQGSSATKAVVVGPDLDVLAVAEVPVRSSRRSDGGVEIDPDALLVSIREAGRRAITTARTGIDAIGVATPGPIVLAWDRASGRALGPAVAGQNRRSAGVCAELTEAGYAADLMRITGLPLDPHFAAPAMAWMRPLDRPTAVVTTLDGWLLHQLTGTYVTDVATASHTLLLDLDRLQWSTEAARWFGLVVDDLPVIVESALPIGITRAFGTAAPVPVTGVATGPAAALFAHGCRRGGEATCSYGTSATLLVNAGPAARRSVAGLAASVAWRIGATTAYGLNGRVYTVGYAVDWLRDLGLVSDLADLDGIGASVPDSAGVLAIPAFAGLGAPYWHPSATGTLTGLRLGTTRGHLARAMVDGIAAQVSLLTGAAVRDLGQPLTAFRVDGPLTRSRLLMQTQADLLQLPVEVDRHPHASALGVAALARIGLGQAGEHAEAMGAPEHREYFEPKIRPEQAAERLDLWRRTVERHLAMERGG